MISNEQQAALHVASITRTMWDSLAKNNETVEVLSLGREDRFRIRFSIKKIWEPVYLDIIIRPANTTDGD